MLSHAIATARQKVAPKQTRFLFSKYDSFSGIVLIGGVSKPNV